MKQNLSIYGLTDILPTANYTNNTKNEVDDFGGKLSDCTESCLLMGVLLDKLKEHLLTIY